MWWYMVLVGCIQAAMLCAHPLGQGSVLWGLSPEEPEVPGDPIDMKMEPIPLRLYGKDPDVYVNNKRAFTLLSRWRPFSQLGRDTPSIREHNRQIFNDLDIETRAMLRPVGQPLRWG